MTLAKLRPLAIIILITIPLTSCLTLGITGLDRSSFLRGSFEEIRQVNLAGFYNDRLINVVTTRLERPSYTHEKTEVREIEHSRLASHDFFGAASAWVVPNSTRSLLFTLDAGARWHPAFNNTASNFGQISFINRLSGWMIGSKGEIWKTEDGGQHWIVISKLYVQDETAFYAKQVKFIDGLHGWVIESPHYLWRTEDGGQKWQRYSPLGEGVNLDLIRLYFINPSIGWLGCSKGIMLRTSNGGNSWESIKISETGPFYDLWFADKKTGWALIGNSIYNTLDGGKTWRMKLSNEEAFESPIILSLFFITQKVGWAVGHSNMWAGKAKVPAKIKGVIYETTDGGETWNEVVANIQDNVFSKIFFSDPKHGWLISTDHVYRTNDGGLSWKPSLKIP